MTVELNPFTRDAGTFAAIGSAFTVTLGKMLDGGREVAEGAKVLPYVRAGNIQDAGLDLSDANSMAFTPAEAANLDLRAGDVLVVEGGAVGTSVVLTEDMPDWSFQKTVNRLRCSGDWEPRYVSYVLTAYRDAGVIDIVCNKSTIPHLTAEKLRALRVPAWEPSRQRAIANYLDHETAQIDTLIAAQERLIELLRERRRAVLDEVTSTAAGSMMKLKFLFRPSSVANRPDEQVLSVYRDYGVIPKASRDDNFNRTPENVERYLLVQEGDLVVNRMKAWQGSLGISTHRGIVSGDYEVAVPITTKLLPQFAHVFLRSPKMIAEYAVRSTGIRPSQWRLYWDQMGDIEVPVPTVAEQASIVERIEEQAIRIDALVAEAERFIVLARERRLALITAAVTGQIDVSAAA